MYRFVFTLAVSLLVAPAALGQSVKQVEVTNLPEVQDVSVTNAPLDVAIASPPAVQLVGFTSTPRGCGGLFTLHADCLTEFGAATRACTSAEIISTTDVPSGLTGWAMVIPTFVGTASDQSRATDASGLADGSTNFTCNGWTGSPIARHLLVDATGTFRVDSPADVAAGVACCALVP